MTQLLLLLSLYRQLAVLENKPTSTATVQVATPSLTVATDQNAYNIYGAGGVQVVATSSLSYKGVIYPQNKGNAAAVQELNFLQNYYCLPIEDSVGDFVFQQPKVATLYNYCVSEQKQMLAELN